MLIQKTIHHFLVVNFQYQFIDSIRKPDRSKGFMLIKRISSSSFNLGKSVVIFFIKVTAKALIASVPVYFALFDNTNQIIFQKLILLLLNIEKCAMRF